MNETETVAQGVSAAMPHRSLYKVFEKKDYDTWQKAENSQESTQIQFEQWLNLLAFNGWELLSLSTEEMDFCLLARR